ncbi:SIMPL domain-containing protein [Shewanella gelidii]|uniref:Oxidative stress defense protein n=1 Tax=Shewanella gelidii TaxID=1642821 RepID=A0A917JP92_9GAMM|nr:SIMPL domain-containing protein [Shewanella gelidii]MCL1099218.1 SIMPL domain-containing protein [Shewanella gelidii]GGI76553.1 oxidative stress defense protein [Shewanella gelidii]
MGWQNRTTQCLNTFIILCCTTYAQLSAANGLPDHRYISVTGSAEVTAKPDIAVVQLHLESTQPTSLAAKNNVDQRVNQFLKGLKAFKVDKQNVSASSINTQPNYQYGSKNKREITGYSARRDVTVSLEDISLLNALMDFALEVKVNQIRHIELKSSKAESLKADAIQLAVKNARNQGQILAQSFGAKLGPIYSISQHTQHSQYRFGANRAVEMMADAKAANAPGQYLQENIKFSASVNAVFDLTID